MPTLKLKVKKRFFNEKFFPYLHLQCYLQLYYGGASSGKSAFAAQRRVIGIVTEPRNYLIIRNTGTTLRSSVYTETVKAINQLQLRDYFDFSPSLMEITYNVDGRKILFRGLDDVERLKSIIVPVGVLTDVEVEEATEISEFAFDQLELRMRGKSPCKKRMSLWFNPVYKNHWICKRFFDGKWITRYYDGNKFILHSTHLDNNFLEEDDHRRIENKTGYFREVYAHGKWGVLGDLVFTKWIVRDLSKIKEKFTEYRYGGDFGFTNDPTAIIRLALDFRRQRIYILDEIYERGLTNDMILHKGKDLIGQNVIWWDCAEPKSIQELRNGITLEGALYSMYAEPVKKGKDSVNHGIQWLQQWQWIIDVHCQNTINEIQTFQWKKNKDGESINEAIGEDHALTAIRYATEQDQLYGNDFGLSTINDIEIARKDDPFIGDPCYEGSIYDES